MSKQLCPHVFFKQLCPQLMTRSIERVSPVHDMVNCQLNVSHLYISMMNPMRTKLPNYGQSQYIHSDETKKYEDYPAGCPGVSISLQKIRGLPPQMSWCIY